VPGIKAAKCGLVIEPGRVIVGDSEHPGQSCVIYKAVGREAVPDPECRHCAGLIALFSVANGMVMAANDKTCPRVAEIVVDRSHSHAQLVRCRDT
jgi:hypothetical protein